MSPIYTIQGDQETQRIALLTDGITYDLFNTIEEAETCREALRKEDPIIEFVEDAIIDLFRELMAAPYNLTEPQARIAIRAEVNN